MRLIVNGFRCHQARVLDLPDTGFTLLSGPSGAGKTTYMEAIAWVLHGKTTDVNDHGGGGSGGCAVQLELANGIVVYRQKKPERLLVRLPNGMMYEDKVAQQLIDATYGSRLAWQACCYLPQRCRNVLLTGSNMEKMQVLNELSFSTEDPEQYLAVIDHQITQTNVQFTVMQNQYVQDANAFQRDVTQQRPDMSRWLSPEQRDAHRVELTQAKQRLGDLANDLVRYRETLSQRQLLQRQRDTIVRDLDALRQQRGSDVDDRIQQLEVDLQRQLRLPAIQAQRRLQDQIKVIDRQVQELPAIPETLTGLGVKALQERLRDHTNRTVANQRLGLLLQEEGYPADPSDPAVIPAITDLINGLERQHRTALSRLTIRNVFAEYTRIKASLSQYPVVAPADQETVDKITNDLTEAQRSRDVLSCPHCSGHVRLVDRRLQTATSAPVTQDKINELQRGLTDARQRLAQINERQRLQVNLDDKRELLRRMGVDDLDAWAADLAKQEDHPDVLYRTIQKHQKIRDQVEQWQKSVVIQNPITESPIEIQNAIQRRELETRLAELQAGVDPTLDLTQDLASGPGPNATELRREIDRLRNLVVKINVLEQQLEELHVQLGQPKFQELDQQPDPSLEHQACQQRIDKIQADLLYTETLQRFVDRQTELAQRRDQVLTVNQRVLDLQRLRTAAIEVECETLQSTVDVINATVNDVLEGIFDQPIRVTFSLFKALKTKAVDGSQRVKPMVNVTIGHKGNDYARLGSLSGGEGDRISLAVTMALNRLSTCPFVMIDEAMSSIDGHLKEACIETLRDLVGENKALYCVNHEVTEGHYDAVIRVEP